MEVRNAKKKELLKSEYQNLKSIILLRYCTLYFLCAYILIGGMTEVALGSIFCINSDPDGFYSPTMMFVLW